MDTGLSELLRTCVFIRKEMGPGSVPHTTPHPPPSLSVTLPFSKAGVFSLDPCLAPAVTGGSWRGELVLFAVSCWKRTGFRLLLVLTAPL